MPQPPPRIGQAKKRRFYGGSMEINGYLCKTGRAAPQAPTRAATGKAGRKGRHRSKAKSNETKKETAMSTISLQQNVIKEVASLFDNEEAMRKVLSFVKKVKKAAKAQTEELTPSEKEEVMGDLRESLMELKMVKEGKLQSRPVEELFNEL